MIPVFYNFFNFPFLNSLWIFISVYIFDSSNNL